MKKYLLISLMFLGTLVSVNNVFAEEKIISESAKIIISSPSDGEVLSGGIELVADISSLLKEDEANGKLNYKFWYSNGLISRTDTLSGLSLIGKANCDAGSCSLKWDTNSVVNGAYNLVATASTGGSDSEAVDSTDMKILFNSESVSVQVKNEVITTYLLKYSAGPNGTIEGNLNQIVNQDEKGTEVTAVAKQGSHFVNWSDGLETASRVDMGTKDIDVTANFAFNMVTLTYKEGGNGVISGNTSQEVSQYAYSEEVTAIANSGYVFVNWSDGLETASRIDQGLQDITFTANFAVKRISRGGGSSGSYIKKDVVVTPIVTTPTPVVGEVLGAEKFIFTKFLKTGKIDNEVLELQKFLNANNFVVALTGPGSVGNETTKFGALTRQAVIKFQISRGLVGDGQVGAKTRTELNK